MKRYFYYVSYVYRDDLGRVDFEHVEYSAEQPIASIESINGLRAQLAALPRHERHSSFCVLSFQLLRVEAAS